jgi:hypothetical protein
MKMAVFWVVAPCRLATHRPDDGGSTDSETSVNSYQSTRRYNPEDSHLRRTVVSYSSECKMSKSVVESLQQSVTKTVTLKHPSRKNATGNAPG